MRRRTIKDCILLGLGVSLTLALLWLMNGGSLAAQAQGPGPAIAVSPVFFDETLAWEEARTLPLTLGNDGTGDLIYAIWAGGDAVPWLFTTPAEGTVPAGGAAPVDVTFDASQVSAPGIYQANVAILSNDVFTSTTILPVQMTVEPSSGMGQLGGAVTSDLPGGPIAGALVGVLSGETVIISGTTDVDGLYGPWWLVGGDYTVRVSADLHLDDVQDVGASAGEMTTHDVMLTRNTRRIEVRVSSNSDDAEEFPGGYVYRTSPDLELIWDSRLQTVGLRFVGVEIPQGAAIVDAYVQFQTDEKTIEPVLLLIEGEATDDALTFSSTSKNITSRARTGASVTWEPAPWTTVGEAGPAQQAGGLAPVIQEIVSRPGWTSGNALALIVTGDDTPKRVAESYEGDPSGAPLLHIEYTIGPPVNWAPVVNAGSDQTVIFGASALLDGTAIDDGLPNPPGTVTVEWNQVSGPGTVTFADPSAVDTVVTFSDTGVYILSLSADDGELTTGDEVVVTVEMSVNDLLVYPYLGETTTTSAVISWATDVAGDSQVRYSADQSYGNTVPAVSSVYDGKHWHSATVTGLITDTAYYYRVYTGDDDMTPWSRIVFTTAPEPVGSSFTFVVLGDSQANAAATDVAAAMSGHSFDLVLRPGDLVINGGICTGQDSSWNQYVQDYFNVYQARTGNTPFYPSIGNHDLSGGECGYQGYTDVFSLPDNAPPGDEQEYYSFDWGNAHFVALDTNQRYGSKSAQYAWLMSDLQGNAQPWTFVFFHFPAYSSGEHGSSPGVQTYLVPVFETYGVDVVFNGHDHDYERTCPIDQDACTTSQDGGIVYYVSGGGGGVLRDVGSSWFTAYSDSLYHFVKVEVDDCRVRMDAIDLDGAVFDSYTIDRCSE